MTPVERPLRELMDTRTSEREILGVWKRIQERRSARRARRPAFFAALSVATLLVVFVVGFAWLRHPGEHGMDGPLAVRGLPIERPLAGGDELVQTTSLSDGSRLILHPGARLSVLENSGHVFVTHLSGGQADFSVKPGGSRRWVVECGNATIEVVGTEFSLTRSANDLVVEVRHGVVLVRGEDVPDRVRRLTAGESLHVSHEAAPGASASAAALPVPAAASSTRVAPTNPQEASSAVATAAPSASTSAEPVGEVSALYEEADRARRSGRPDEAARLLESAVTREPSGQRAALGCFTLGRLYLESLGQPAAAARAFERSLSAGTPRGLEEDARARLVEARARMSDAPGARRAAEEYRARFPDGRRASEVNRWSPGE